MILSADEFVERLRSSGLLAEPGIEESVAQLAAETPSSSADQLAHALVEQGRLTPYQATAVCEGRAARLILGKYVILEKLGEGGMGQVFKARHRYMDRVVALKTLPGTLADTPEAAARFQREARAAARLDHPNIVKAFDADECDGVPFLAMELVDGTDLAVMVRRNGPLPVEQAVNAVRQAAAGLACAHAQGIVHRDIKPGNLLLDKQGTVKVLDLGLARLVQTAQESSDHLMLTTTGHVAGTIDYMSPEQADDMRRADARSDIYSLGCTLWTLLTGRAIYPGESAAERLVRHLEAPIPTLRAVRPEVPEPLDRLFQRMVAKRPEHRPQSMAELVDMLAHPERFVGRDRTGLRFPASRRARVWLALGACLAILLFGLGMLGLRRGASLPPPAIAPFDAAQARKHQEAWAEYLGVPVVLTNSIEMKLTLIPPGEFQMGWSVSAEEIDRRFPQHLVRLTRPFYLGTHEVTVADFRRFVTATGHKTTAEKEGTAWSLKDGEWGEVKGLTWKNPGFDQRETHPVPCVSWEDAVAFCHWLSREEGRTYRLPTEAEWEYACRAGTDTLFFWGDDADGGEGYVNGADETGRPGVGNRNHRFNFKDGYAATSPVGRFKPNGFGLYDMLGNVWEWCSDWYGEDYYGVSPVDDPPGAAAGSYRVTRGGGWLDNPWICRSANRHGSTPGARNYDLGFRVASSPVDASGQ